MAVYISVLGKIYWKKKAKPIIEPPIPNKATSKDRKINPVFSFSNFRSKAASRTIITSPTLPRTSSVVSSFNSSSRMLLASMNALIPIPSAMSIRTDGMFVFFAIILKKKLRMITVASAIMSKYGFMQDVLQSTQIYVKEK